MKAKRLIATGLALAMTLSLGSSLAFAEDSGDRTKLTLFVDETWWTYDTWEGRIPEKVSDDLGIDIEATIAADDTELNLMIASGDMPDIICSSGKFSRLCDPNVCYTLDELAEMAGEELDVHPVMRLVNEADDGNLYTLMAGYSPDYYMEEYPKAVYEGPGLVIRTDIWEEMGSPEINSLDDLEECLAWVKENYPDMVPFAYNATHQNGFIKILCGATNNTDGFVDVDGEAVPFIYDPNFETYFELMNDWYLKGYISDEVFAFNSDSDDLEYMIAGNLFCDSYYSDTSDAWNNSSLPEAGVDYTVTQLIDITYADGAQWLQTNAGWRGLWVSKSCEDPVAAYEFLKYCWSEEGQCTLLWGEEGVDWEWSDDHSYPILNYDFQNPNEDEGMKYWGWLYHDGVRNTLPDYDGPTTTTYDARRALTDIAVENPVLGTIRVPADSDELVIMNNLTELFNTSAVQIITASSPEESKQLYYDMLDTASDLGADELSEWAAPLYTEKKAAYDEIKDLGADGE